LKKTLLLSTVVVILFILIPYLVTAREENISMDGPELQVGIFGASIAGGLRRTGFIIYNNGDQSISDIHWVYSIKSSANDEVDLSYSDELVSLENNSAYQFSTPDVNGFGLVTLSLSVSSSNAGDKTFSINGFQIGSFMISQPWILAWYIF